MKKWYFFYSGAPEFGNQIQNLTEQLDLGSIKLNQIGAEIAGNSGTVTNRGTNSAAYQSGRGRIQIGYANINLLQCLCKI